jgi:hypothetical protein
MYIQRLVKNLVQKTVFVFEIFSFEVDAYMYVQKTYKARQVMDPRIRIRTKMSRIWKTAHTIALLYRGVLRQYMYVKSLKPTNSGIQIRKRDTV